MSQIYRVDAILSDAPSTVGVQIRPPIAYWSFAPQWVLSGSIVSGQYSSNGTIRGEWQISPQDTYLVGSSGSGIAFTAQPSGSYTSASMDPMTNKYRILITTTSAGASGTITETSERTDTTEEIRLWIAPSPIGMSPTSSNRYMYIYLNYGIKPGYRIKLAHGAPVVLQRTEDGTSWAEVYRLTGLSDIDQIIRQGGELTFRVEFEAFRLWAELNQNPDWLLHHGSDTMPDKLRTRIEHRSMPYAVAVYPASRSSVQVKAKVPAPNLSPSTKVAASTGSELSIDSWAVDTSNGVEVDISSTGPIADIALIDYGEYGYPPPAWPPVLAQTQQYAELQKWDDFTHVGACGGSILLRDDCDQLRYAHGVRAVRISAADGYSYAPRCFGLAGADMQGLQIVAQAPAGYGRTGFVDVLSAVSQDALCYEMVLDGFALHTAVRLILLAAGVAPAGLSLLPDPGPPPYDDSMPLPVLGRGTPGSPRYRIPAGTTYMAALQSLLRDQVYVESAPYGYIVASYMLWMDPLGMVHLEPWIPQRQSVAAIYTAAGPDNPPRQHQIISQLDIITSPANLRTDIHVQGIDPISYELIHGHRTNLGLLYDAGWRRHMLIRSPAISDETMAEMIMRLAEQQSSMRHHVVRFQAAFDPTVYAGQVILVGAAELRGMWPYTIMQIETQIPPGVSTITARSLVEAGGII